MTGRLISRDLDVASGHYIEVIENQDSHRLIAHLYAKDPERFKAAYWPGGDIGDRLKWRSTWGRSAAAIVRDQESDQIIGYAYVGPTRFKATKPALYGANLAYGISRTLEGRGLTAALCARAIVEYFSVMPEQCDWVSVDTPADDPRSMALAQRLGLTAPCKPYLVNTTDGTRNYVHLRAQPTVVLEHANLLIEQLLLRATVSLGATASCHHDTAL